MQKTISHKTIEIHPKFFRFPKRINNYLFMLFMVVVSIPVTVFADTIPKNNTGNATWHITSDIITYNKNEDLYTAEGNVIIKKDQEQMTSDKIILNNKTMETVATGNVIVSSDGDTIRADRVSMNLKTKTGTIEDGEIFIESNNYYLSGDLLQKTGEDTYTGKKVTVTACDGDHPDWKISGKDLKVTIGGYGTVRHAFLWAKSIPVFYTPFFIFPVKLERQTGLLSPRINFSSRKGFQYEQPFFWDISNSMDMTFYGNYMSKRGVNTGLEYRYTITDLSKSACFFNYLSDEKTDNDLNTLDGPYGYGEDRYLRPDDSRYWFRMKTDQEMPLGILAKLDIDYVSDQDYLKEFKESQSGYRETDKYFTQNFGRGLDDYNISTRINSIVFTKNAFGYTINTGAKYYDNVIVRRGLEVDGENPPFTFKENPDDTTLQSLPFVHIDGLKQKIPGTPMNFVLSSAYINYDRKDTDRPDPANDTPFSALKLSGQMFDLYPRIFLPLQLKSYASIDPSIGFRYTTWHLDDIHGNGGTPERSTYDINVDLSTEVYKIFNMDRWQVSKIKHTIQPLISYSYIPDKSYDTYPAFDPAYTVYGKNLITWSVTQTLTSKFPEPKSAKPPESSSAENVYNTFLRLFIEQSYNLEDDAQIGWTYKKHSPLYGELYLTPTRILSLRADAKLERGSFKERNLSAVFSSKRGDTLQLTHRKKYKTLNPDPFESVYAGMKCLLSKKLSLYSDYERNIETGEDIKKLIGIIFKKQCWKIDLNYAHEEEDKKFGIMVTLVGLGEIETSVSGR